MAQSRRRGWGGAHEGSEGSPIGRSRRQRGGWTPLRGAGEISWEETRGHEWHLDEWHHKLTSSLK